MTLTVGSGPLSGRQQAKTNFRVDGPEHQLLFEDYPQRLRAVVGGRVVLDSTRASILHETGYQIVPYVPIDDLDAALLERSATSTHCPYKGDASYWSLRIGEQVVEDAVWAYEAPLESAQWLAGFAALKWDVAEEWFIEDEVAFGPHLRDPYHRVDVFESSRPATVRVGETVIARTRRPKLLFETSLPPRVYVARADIDPAALIASETRTQCPYKGQAAYYSVQVDGRRIEDAAWTYDTPLPEGLKVAGDVCFLKDGITVELEEPDGR